jgi:hypothetical protein
MWPMGLLFQLVVQSSFQTITNEASGNIGSRIRVSFWPEKINNFSMCFLINFSLLIHLYPVSGATQGGENEIKRGTSLGH